jgi:hypothetical protein
MYSHSDYRNTRILTSLPRLETLLEIISRRFSTVATFLSLQVIKNPVLRILLASGTRKRYAGASQTSTMKFQILIFVSEPKVCLRYNWEDKWSWFKIYFPCQRCCPLRATSCRNRSKISTYYSWLIILFLSPAKWPKFHHLSLFFVSKVPKIFVELSEKIYFPLIFLSPEYGVNKTLAVITKQTEYFGQKTSRSSSHVIPHVDSSILPVSARKYQSSV